ncbi:helix-turn-helix domain containing protein [Brucella sp. 21LCYQ03]|nr:helix-turn-helix domain containing protein [Brucella sp. 21LCYQ03]
MQDRLKALQSDVEGVSNIRFGEQAQQSRNWKYDVIRPILDHAKGSSSRSAMIAKLDGTTLRDWRGKPILLSRSQLYRWIAVYEQGEGIHGLAHKVRKDKGTQKAYVSREFTRSAPLDDETKAAIHSDLKQYVRRLIKGGAQRKQTRVLAADKLKELYAGYGFICNDQQREALIFNIPHEFVQHEMHFKAVYRHQKDRKASEDNKPRIRRSTANLMPMEIVVMDVHHINVLVAREDGSTATPKLLAFHDIATNRVFCEVIFFESRGGVRNVDIISAFVNMCKHPAFGVPQFLYVDNGSEYGFADDLEDALKLGCKVLSFTGDEERNRVIRAKAYNAAAKHVEGWFRQMNQQYFRHIQGWIDDDRMNPKRPAMGKLPAPFNLGFEAFCQTIYAHLQAYEHMPQNGALKGKSPAVMFGEQVRAGWKATILDSDRLLTVFTKPETRVVRKHGIEVRGGDPWTCDGLLEYFGRTVLVHIPKYHGFAELLVTDEAGNHIGIAIRDRAFDVLDTRGAKESARRVSLRNKALTRLAKSVPDIDVGAELIAYGAKQLPVVPNAPDGVISVNSAASVKRALLPVAPEQKSREQMEEEQRIIDEARSALVRAGAAMNRRAS